MTANTGREVVVDVDRDDAGRLQGVALQVQRLRPVGAGPPLRGRAAPPSACSRRARSGGFGLHAQSSHPPPERVSAPAPNAGSRRRGGRRPRPDLEPRSGLHPAAVKGDGHGMGGEPLPLRRRTRPA